MKFESMAPGYRTIIAYTFHNDDFEDMAEAG